MLLFDKTFRKGYSTKVACTCTNCVSALHSILYYMGKGGLLSESISNLVPLPKKGAKRLPCAESVKKLFTVKLMGMGAI